VSGFNPYSGKLRVIHPQNPGGLRRLRDERGATIQFMGGMSCLFDWPRLDRRGLSFDLYPIIDILGAYALPSRSFSLKPRSETGSEMVQWTPSGSIENVVCAAN
jgi:hypothetical protein